MSAFKTLRLTALDTLFFRESRPLDAIGGSELVSIFPPSPRTVLGAVRSAIGDTLGADWKQFHAEKESYVLPNGRSLYDLIGWGDELGKLSLAGLWLSLDDVRLYPAPLFLLHNKINFGRLRIGTAVRTHVGTVRLPTAPDREHGYRPFEDSWLTGAGLLQALEGGNPDNDELRQRKDLFTEESRLGIARDNSKRTVRTGLLYQTRHIRPMAGFAIDANISGLDDSLNIEGRIVRLGGEGRMADIYSVETPKMPDTPRPHGDTRGLILVLLTSALFKNEHGNWLPPRFSPAKSNGADVWRGEINSVSLTLHAVALGKTRREGGWNMAECKPRDVQSLLSPGGSYYCTVDNGNIATAIDALHGKQIGEDQELGRGVIACGLWNQNEFPIDHPGGKA